MNVLFLGGFAASQFEWIAPVIESDVETSVVTDDHDPTRVAVAIGEADIIVSEAWRAGMPTAPRLKLLQLPVAGTDRVETAALPPGVTVCNAYGHEMAMAEYVVMAMLVWSHRYFDIAIDRPDYPALRRYYDRLTARPAFREHVMVSYEELVGSPAD